MKTFSAVLLLALLSLASCVGPGKLTTPSGKAEVLIAGHSLQQVGAALKDWAPTKGQAVVAIHPTVIETMGSVEVPVQLYTKQSVGTRTVYNLVEGKSGVTVHAVRFIGASRDPYGYYVPMPAANVLTNEYNSQDGLEELQAELEDFARTVGVTESAK